MKTHLTPRRHAVATGFTLVEMLVTVAIIALLLALLTPTLEKARQSAIQAMCLNHHSQIRTASGMYANDNSGMLLPPWGPGIPPAFRAWPAALDKYLGGDFRAYEDSTTKFGKGNFQRKDGGNAKPSDVWWCPATEGNTGSHSDRVNYGVAVSIKRSTGLSGASQYYGARLGQFDRPGQLMFTGDAASANHLGYKGGPGNIFDRGNGKSEIGGINGFRHAKDYDPHNLSWDAVSAPRHGNLIFRKFKVENQHKVFREVDHAFGTVTNIGFLDGHAEPMDWAMYGSSRKVRSLFGNKD